MKFRARRRREVRKLTAEKLEARRLLAADNLSIVPLWDGETAGPPDQMLNRLGGNSANGINAQLSFESSTVHSGSGAFRIDTNGTIPVPGFDFVGTSFTGFGMNATYVDTRDLTNFSELRFWLKNETGAPFRLVLEIKDFNDSDSQKARYPVTISAANGWTEIAAPLDFNATGWMLVGEPELSRAKSLTLVIESTTDSVTGNIFLDDMTLTEKGGDLNPQTASFDSVLSRIGERQFRALWGSRDRATGLVPKLSNSADVMALNSTAGLLQSLPSALELGWVSETDANNYVALVVGSLNTAINKAAAISAESGSLPPRYLDRVQLTPNDEREESPVDAAFVFLAMHQYRSLPTTSDSLGMAIDGLLDRFNFEPFSTAAGWRLKFDYDDGFSSQTYDGYSTEIFVISLAAHLSGTNQIPIETHWDSGVLRTSAFLADPANSHLVHTQPEFRAPFLQWLLHMFVDVSDRAEASYPKPQRPGVNPYSNAVLYQRDVMQRLEQLGRPTFAQPDASDDGTGNQYQQFSLYNNFGQPDLFMPWSSTFALHASVPQAEPAIRDLLSRDLHGPLGFSDSVVWDTDAPMFTSLPAVHDFWNIALSTMAITNFLTGSNADYSQETDVSDALDVVLGYDSTNSLQFLEQSAHLYDRSYSPQDHGSPAVYLYSDNRAGGDYFNDTASGNIAQLDGNDPDAARGTSSWRISTNAADGYFEFGLAKRNRSPRDIPAYGSVDALRFSARGDSSGQEVQVIVRRNEGGVFSFAAIETRTLTTSWQEYAIDLSALPTLRPNEVEYVQFKLPVAGTVRLDDIRLSTDGTDPLQLIQSYRPGGWATSGVDVTVFPNHSFLYDVALAAKAFFASGDSAMQLEGLKQIRAILATESDGTAGYFNEQSSGYVLLADATARNPHSQRRTVGDNAWIGLSLLDAFRLTGNALFLTRAREISDWFEAELRADDAKKGYFGGYDAAGDAFPWRSTEYNIDAFELNRQIAEVLELRGDTVSAQIFTDRADHAATFVLSMFDSSGFFWTGTTSGEDINMSSVPLDAQLWPLLTLAQSPDYANAEDYLRALEFAEAQLVETDGATEGFTFSTGATPNRVWLEGVAQGASVYHVLGETDKRDAALQTLQQLTEPNGGILAVSSDSMLDPSLGSIYDSRQAVAPTAWTILVQMGRNAFAPVVTELSFDFGDAPSLYPTNLPDGARHFPLGPRLGGSRDAEPNGQPTPDADGDGTDEDGVMFGNVKIGNAMAAVNIDLQNATNARIDAWIDFDGNGVWDAADQILDDQPVIAGLQTLNFPIPGGAVAGDTFARVRVSSAGDLDATGLALDGEVEDFRLMIIPSNTPTVEKVEVNGGDAQRNVVTELAVTFDSEVNAPGSAFTIKDRDSEEVLDNSSLIVNSSVIGGKTVSVLTFGFPGNLIEQRTNGIHSLRDGNFQLDFDPAQITSVGGGPNLAGDVSFGDVEADAFYRFYGDNDGDRDNDVTDLGQFGLTFRSNSTLPNYNPDFDRDGDGDVDVTDLGQFSGRFRSRMEF